MNRDLDNFRNIAFNLHNTTDDVFERFFEKLYEMDKEYLYIYLITHKSEFSKSQMIFAKKYYEIRKHYYNWNLKHIYICNERKVSSVLGINVGNKKKRVDILEIDECIDFIIRYNNYFKDVNVNNFKTFTKETKLNLTNLYRLSNSLGKNATYIRNIPKRNIDLSISNKSNNYITEITFNELGSSIDRVFNYELYNHDLLVINEADNLILKDNNIILDNNCIYTLNNEEVSIINDNENLYYEIRYELSISNSIDEKIKIINKKYNFKCEFKENIKQIYLSSFGELFVLYDNGDLYRNNELYATNVLTIYEINSYVSYLIFNNNDVEYITSHYEIYNNLHYDKIIFNDYYIAFLKNKNLEVINICEDPDRNYHTFFYNIDDIKLGDEINEIKLIKGKEEIIHSTSSYLESYE